MYCLSNFCCVCLTFEINLVNINKLDDDNVPIINKLIFIAFGHERLDFEITKLICGACLESLRTAYKFKTTCLINHELIRGYNNQVKYFTGSVGVSSDLKVSLREYPRGKPKKHLRKPCPRSKQKIKTELRVRNRYKCKYCKATFDRGILRLVHYNKKHLNANAEHSNCSMCKKQFRNLKLLNRHIHKTHFNDTQQFCRHCKQKFQNRKTFIRHMKTKHNYNNFTCNICNAKYLKDYNYRKHLTTHENKRVRKQLRMITRYLVCNNCDEIFVNAELLLQHNLLVHEDATNVENAPNESEIPEKLNENLPVEVKQEPPSEIPEVKEEIVEENLGNNNDIQIDESEIKNEFPEEIKFEIEENSTDTSCKICSKEFKFLFGLNQHLKTHIS